MGCGGVVLGWVVVGGFGEKWRLILPLGSIATIGVSRKYIILM